MESIGPLMAQPFANSPPWVFIVRNAGADLDRAGADVAPIDVPAFLWRFGISAAGEFRACAIIR
jgi:hypothetical protein